MTLVAAWVKHNKSSHKLYIACDSRLKTGNETMTSFPAESLVRWEYEHETCSRRTVEVDQDCSPASQTGEWQEETRCPSETRA